ncbi:extracellular calcium-sensing receptor-like [Mixophyes fleayi]|uniref:extracellular calcium-sensing receptor-like n=1 Tax=Mixophyes fleayi TaxID=3061075 RepID=UPI003F4E2F45
MDRNPELKDPGTKVTVVLLARGIRFDIENYQMLQATLFSLEEINNNHNILPNITLGLHAYDSCDVLHLDLKGSLQVLTGLNTAIPNYRCLPDIPLAAVLGASISTHSISIAQILGLSRLPQISYYSTSSLLSDRTQFPSFFRTVPSDAFQSHGLARLILHFRWSWVGLLAADNDYGQLGIQLVRQEIVRAGACVEFSESIQMSQPNRNAPHIVKVIKRSTAKVVVVFCNTIDLIPVLNEWLRQNVSKKILIASESWSTDNLFSTGKFSKLLSGTIGLAFTGGTVPGFKMFLKNISLSLSFGADWTKLFWEQMFNCTFFYDKDLSSLETSAKQCTGTEKLEPVQNIINDMSGLRSSYNVYAAVNVVAKAMEDLRNCHNENGPLSLSSCADIRRFKPWQLLRYMKKVRVRLSSGREFYFNEYGDPPAVYDIVSWRLSPEGTMQQVMVGRYDTLSSPDEVFTINTSAISWPIEDHQILVCSESCPPGFRKAAITGQPICCFECVPCPPGEISNQTDSLICLKCPWDQWPNSEKCICLPKTIEYLSHEDSLGRTITAISLMSSFVPVFILKQFICHKNTPLVKASNYFVSCLLLVSLSLCFLCPLVFIGYPQSQNCLLRHAAFGMVFALCISCILAKTITVILAFIATMPDSNLRKWTNSKFSYMVILICSFLQLVLCIAWLTFAPPFPQYNTQSKPELIIAECNEGSPIAFWTMLGYLFLLATISFIVAFLARRLPDSYNEAQFITFSMLAFLSVWVSFIPASLSAQGKYTVAMEIFAILTSSWALVICMFFPKCFVILFRPDVNTRDYLIRSYINKK